MTNSTPPMFSSRSFVVSGLICNSLIHHELTSVYGVRVGQVDSSAHSGPFFQHCLRGCIFPIVYSCLLCHDGQCKCEVICGLSILYRWSMCLFCDGATPLMTVGLQHSLKSRTVMPLTLFFLLFILAIQCHLCFHKILELFVLLLWKHYWYFDRDCTESVDCLSMIV